MRALLPKTNIALLARQFETSPFLAELREQGSGFDQLDESTARSILEEAAKFADTYLQPLNDAGDAQGCHINDEGRVITCDEHKTAWSAFGEAGWLALDMPPEFGGQGLPLTLALAVQEVFDRSCNAFGMMLVPVRSAVKLLSAWASDDVKAEWIEPLATGQYSATICISESGAGSDAPRMTTKAEKDANGDWRLTGEKCWISYADQDLTDRIVQCVLARTSTSKGLSLFLVPNLIDGTSNGQKVHRIEEKMGLHVSPTCVLEFDGAKGQLLGEEGRGLAQMFVMITSMRLSVGTQGVAIAHAAFDVALQYAEERRQGGRDEIPMKIAEHADVQRMLLNMAAEIDTARGLGLAISNISEMTRLVDEEQARDFAAFVQWMLPIYKTTGSQVAFQVSNTAMQVLGGAGYTREWPVEQAVRDARVLEIFEGTTGIQGIDLLHRRLWKDEQAGLKTFLRLAEQESVGLRQELEINYSHALKRLADAAELLTEKRASDRFGAEAGADAFLTLAGLCAQGWIAARLAQIEGDDPASNRLRASGERYLHRLSSRADQAFAEVGLGAEALAGFEAIRATA